MSEYLNKILLKPRFSIEINETKEQILSKFIDKLNHEDCAYSRKISGNHIFIDLPKEQLQLWSPQLSISVESENTGSRLRGLFAPKPSVWTFFMFLHFVVAIAFLIFSAMTYANYVAKNEYSLWFGLMLLCIVLWFVLYAAGQLGKHKAKYQMEDLKVFLKDCLVELDIKLV